VRTLQYCQVDRKRRRDSISIYIARMTVNLMLRPDVRFGSEADICSAKGHVRFAPNSDRTSRHAANGHVRFTPKDVYGANRHVCFGPKADIPKNL
jgi:hypothetical protein